MSWRAAPNPYLPDTPVAVNSTSGAFDSTNLRPRVWINPNTFQIISSGDDGKFGIGGQYLAQSTASRLPFINATAVSGPYSNETYDSITGVTKETNIDPNVRQLERDNITNFSGGRLE